MTQETMACDEVGNITDQELVARLRSLIHADQALNARLLVHLGEVDARGLYREHAYASMFAYCVEELQMSEAQAYVRIQAARLSRRFPLIVQLLAQGKLHLTAIKLLGPHLTPDNHGHLLDRASGKGKREIELLLAEFAPKPDVPSRMRKLPSASTPPASSPLELVPSSAAVDATPTPRLESVAAVAAPRACEPPPSAGPRPRASSKPWSPGRYKLELTAGQALHDKLEQLQHLLRHQVPDGDLAVIVERAVDSLIASTLKQRFAQASSPRQQTSRPRNASSRHIPRAVVREVYARDAAQCTFVSADGKRCRERGFLELHHVVPYARGGESTPENLRLTCRAHNALFGERDFGRDFILRQRRAAMSPNDELAPDRALT